MDNRNAVTLTRTNDDEMTTTMTTPSMTTKTNPTVAASKRMCKWSGDEEPQSYYSREDEDTMTLTVGEQLRIQGYHANAQRNWRNADEDNDRRVVAAAQAIVRSIRRETAPRRVSSAVWTTPWDEPVFESEYPDYPDYAEESTHMPFMNLTKEERDKKRTQFKFGLCTNCDTGLSDNGEFVGPVGGFVCNACNDYYARLAQPRACGGCN